MANVLYFLDAPRIICARLNVAVRECCRFNCEHFMLVFLLEIQVLIGEL